ncbi:MAG: 50S ribosomal protein L22 [Thermoleophilaceae bacterium]|nr:50S ribosomal protein L22 [Thermoleophilaceae bacterium]
MSPERQKPNPAQPAEPAASGQAPEGGWSSLKVDELKEQLEARGLPKSGKKDELIARLEEDGAPEAAEQEEAEPSKRARRRGSAETSTEPRKAAPRQPDGDLIVRARSRYVRSAPRKARLVMDNIRGKEVEQARAILTHAPRAVAEDILKLLNSAVANAESAYELGPDELRIVKAVVDEGPTIKRFRPRALGRATPIKKRTSHMTIELTTTANGR